MDAPAPFRRTLHRLAGRRPRLAAQTAALAAIVAIAGMLAIAVSPWIDLEQDWGLPWLYQARGVVPAPDDVLVIAIDEESSEILGVPAKPGDWPRSLHAELVRGLATAGARVIVFDLGFESASADPAHDIALAEAMSAAGNVLVTQSLRKDMQPLDGRSGRSQAHVVIERMTRPTPAIARAAAGQAPFVLPKSARVDAWWAFRHGDSASPMLPVLAMRTWTATDLPAAAGPAPPPALRDRIDATLARLHDGGDTCYFNFYGPARTLQTLPYVRALQALRDPAPGAHDRFRGKAVFVGYAATTPAGQDRLRDDHRTVFTQDDGLNLSGVEIAATGFANLLEDRALHPLSREGQVGVALAWAVLLALIFTTLVPARALVVSGTVVACGLWLVLDRFTHQSSWLPSIVPLAVQWPAAVFGGIWLHYRNTRRDREAIKRNFRYYLPASVVQQLERGTDAPDQRGRVVYGCCLESDITGYTTLAERIGPDELGRLLNDYFAAIFVPVERSGGAVVDVVGDAMVAIWTATASQSEARRKACAGAVEVVAAVDRFNRGQGDRPALPTRFGLHCGDIRIGNVGAEHHYEYRAVGDIINTASRLEGLNKLLGTRLLASAQTVAGVDGLQCRPLGSFRLAGKTNAVDVVELRGPALAADDPDRLLADRFAAALRLHDDRRWPQAADAFAAVLEGWPGDGPSSFYLRRCRELAADPPGDDWQPTVQVESK